MARSFIFGRQAPIVQKVDNAMTELKVLGYNFCYPIPETHKGFSALDEFLPIPS